MLDYNAIRICFDELGLGDWGDQLEPVIKERMSESTHGDFARWQNVLGQLARADDGQLAELLLQLAPWRKGPFDIRGVQIDAEWRSDLKWNRMRDRIASLQGRAILDVGCGNGYYALQMLDSGARAVIGIDPTLLYVMQFLAVTIDRPGIPVHVLPLRLQELPDARRTFDTTFSMGVLYHSTPATPV